MKDDRIRLRRTAAWAISACGLIAACSGTPSAAGTPPATGTSSAAGSSSIGGPTTWTALADPSVFKSADVVGAVSAGPGAVAIGTINKDGHEVATVWTSTDGMSWSAAPGEAGFTDQVFVHLTKLRDRLVAMAFQCPSNSSSGGGGECIGERPWTSVDGVTWEPGQFPQLLESGKATCCVVTNLAAAGPGVVAVAAAEGLPADGEVITSADGKEWTVMPRDKSWTDASLNAVVANGSGVVVIGTRADETFGAWTSADAKAWTPASAVSGKASGEARDLETGGPGLVAVGRDGTSAAIWTSADGTAWMRLPDSDALAGGAINRVALVGSTLVAVGRTGADGAIWTSPDGLTWTRQTPDAFQGYQLTNVVPVDGRVVVFGRTPTSSVGVWTATLP